jgi:hypothetical protein
LKPLSVGTWLEILTTGEIRGEFMKNSLTLVLITLLFVALGCSLDKLTGKKDEVPTPVPESTATTETDSGDKKDTAATDTASGDLSMDKFNKIELGMSYDKVKEVMGSEGNQTSMNKSGSFESASYDWKGDKYARISVRITNGELTYKSQSGLTPGSGTADIDQAKFNKLNIGMSYDEVKGIIGSEGEMTSLMKIAKTTSTSYRWKGEKYSNIFINFRDDKLQNKSQSGLK